MNKKIIKHKDIRDGIWHKDDFVISAKDGVWLYDSNSYFSNSILITNGDFGSQYKNNSDIFSIASSDSDFIAYQSRLFHFGLIDMRNKKIHPFKSHSGYSGGDCIAFSPNSKYLAASTENYTYLYDVNTRNLIKELDALYLGCWSKTDSLLILQEECIEKPYKIIFYDPEIDQIKNSFRLKGYNGWIDGVQVTNTLIFISLRETLIWIDYKNLEKIGEMKLASDYSIKISPDQKLIVLQCAGKPPEVYSLPTFDKILSLEKIVKDIKFSSNSKQVALIDKDNNVELYETEDLFYK